jgi:hypothetical protein
MTAGDTADVPGCRRAFFAAAPTSIAVAGPSYIQYSPSKHTVTETPRVANRGEAVGELLHKDGRDNGQSAQHVADEGFVVAVAAQQRAQA